jgi:hypothetical protein
MIIAMMAVFIGFPLIGVVGLSGPLAARATTLKVAPEGGTLGHTRHAPNGSDPNPLYPLQTVQIKGGYESAGVAMRNLGYGTIDLTGIPSGSTVKYAYLLWDVLNDEPTAATGEGTVDSTKITGTPIGHGESPCWSEATDNYSYVANVTSLVSGNGHYDLTGFASGVTNGEDPWNVGSPAPDDEGASLVVIYANPTSPLTTIQLLGGSTETDSGNLLTQTLTGFTATSSPSASTTFIVADGQGLGSEGGFDATNLVNPFLGTAPQAVPNYSEGNLWDNLTFDVSSDVSAGDTSESVYVEGTGDCLVWIGQVFSVTATPQTQLSPTLISTSMSGGHQRGSLIYVPTGTSVTDSATLSGNNASTATGTVTYNLYSDSACTDLVNSGSPKTITIPGRLPDSAPVTLSDTGSYFWQASYSGDANNSPSTSTCGSEEAVVTERTALRTSLSGDSRTGASISVPKGTAVTDSATLSGTDAAEATGTVTYNVYTDSRCTTPARGGGGAPETITTPGTLPPSAAVSLATPGAYYWQAVYSGDPNNAGSTSTCGSEVETVQSGSPTTCLPVVKHVFTIGNPQSEIVKVLITGSCLGGANRVMFGGLAATAFTVGYGNNIVASPPQQPAGKVDVTVTTPGGTSALNPPDDQYTYYLPRIIQVLPSHGPVTGGNTVLIRGLMFSGSPAPTVSFGAGNFSSSVVVTSDDVIRALVPPHSTGTVDIQVTAFTGTSLPIPADHYTYKS